MNCWGITDGSAGMVAQVKALGAALGEDLTAASDEGAPRYWREVAGRAGPALPGVAEPLSRHVEAPGLLAQSQHRLTGRPMRRSYSASHRP